MQKTCNVDLRHAKAYSEDDEANIKKAVEATAGFAEVNKQVIGIMTDWILRKGLFQLMNVSQEDGAWSRLQDNLAALLQRQGKLAEAKALHEDNVAKKRRLLGDTNPFTLIANTNLGMALYQLGDHVRAETLVRDALTGCRIALFPQDPEMSIPISSLAKILSDQKKFVESEALFRESLEIVERVRGRDHPQTWGVLAELGTVLQKQGKFDEASRLLLEAWEGRQKTLGSAHPDTVASLVTVARILADERKYEDAHSRFSEALDYSQQVLGDFHPATLTIMRDLSSLHLEQDHVSEARSLAEKASRGFRRCFGDSHPQTVETASLMVRIAERSAKFEIREEKPPPATQPSVEMLAEESQPTASPPLHHSNHDLGSVSTLPDAVQSPSADANTGKIGLPDAHAAPSLIAPTTLAAPATPTMSLQPGAFSSPAGGSTARRVPRNEVKRWLGIKRRYFVLGGVFLGAVAWFTFAQR